MRVEILPLFEDHFERLFQVFSGVVREKKYLSWITVPPCDGFAYYRSVIESKNPAFVATADEEMLGACDIGRATGDAHSHIGQLGIFLSPNARRKGIGRRLMVRTMSKAHEIGISRIELAVRADNSNAVALYESLGFEIEGRHRRSFLVDDKYYDSYTMAHLRDADA